MLLKLLTVRGDWSFRSLGSELFMSNSEVHEALRRAKESELFNARRQSPIMRNLEEFVIHGLRYSFPAKRGTLVRGIPTSYAAEPLKDYFQVEESVPPPVWSHSEGTVSGYALEPLYKSVPQAAMADIRLYELLILIDALRDGRVREKRIASDLLRREFSKHE